MSIETRPLSPDEDGTAPDGGAGAKDAGGLPRDAPRGEDFWGAAPGLAAVRDWARARRAGPYALLGEVLLQVAARIPPHVMLPPLGAASGDNRQVYGAASLNETYASVGPSGLSKGECHQLAGEIIAWPDGTPAPVYAPLGSGEGIAATYVACHRDDQKQYVMVRLAWSAVFAATEIDKVAALLGRRAATLGGVLRAAWSGEPLGEANATEDRRRHVPRHTYRAGIMLHVQPGRSGCLLSADEAAAGTPQRILWLPAPDPDIPDTPPPAPARIQWDPAAEVTAALAEVEARGLDQLGDLVPVILPVCEQARTAIDAAAVARHRGHAGALDGHALLVREKLAAVLGIYLGGFGVDEREWQLAGHLMATSDATREMAASVLRRAEEQRNDACGHAEAKRNRIITDAAEQDQLRKAESRVIEVLREKRDWIAASGLRRRLSPVQRDWFHYAVERLEKEGLIVSRETAPGHGSTQCQRLKAKRVRAASDIGCTA